MESEKEKQLWAILDIEPDGITDDDLEKLAELAKKQMICELADLDWRDV